MADKSISQLDTAPSANIGDLFVIAAPDQSSASGFKSYKIPLSVLAAFAVEDIVYTGLETTAQSIVGAINEIYGVVLTGTLTAGNTTLTLQNAAITTNSTVDIYTDTFGVNPTDVTLSSGSITLTFESQATDVAVKVIIK